MNTQDSQTTRKTKGKKEGANTKKSKSATQKSEKDNTQSTTQKSAKSTWITQQYSKIHKLIYANYTLEQNWQHNSLIFWALFCAPYLIVKPHILYRIWRTKQGMLLPQPRKRANTWLRRCGVGAFFGFVFWLPFWFVCLEFFAPSVAMIGGGILAALLFLYCIVCLFYCVEKAPPKNDLPKDSLQIDSPTTDLQRKDSFKLDKEDSQFLHPSPTPTQKSGMDSHISTDLGGVRGLGCNIDSPPLVMLSEAKHLGDTSYRDSSFATQEGHNADSHISTYLGGVRGLGCNTDSQICANTQAHHADSQIHPHVKNNTDLHPLSNTHINNTRTQERILAFISPNKSAQYWQFAAFPLFLLFMLLCVGIFSLAHKNSFVGASLSYPLSIALFVFMPRQYRFWFGFFIGIFGFYWMTLSFRFEGFGALIPLGILAVGVIYGVFFWILCYFENLMCRLAALLLLFVVYPLDFNWLNLAYLSAYTIFQASSLGMLCIACAWSVFALKSVPKWIAPCLLLAALDYKIQVVEPQLQAQIIETNDAQDERWQPQQQAAIIERNLKDIEQAIQEGQPLIILPETSFPFLLNMEEDLYESLLELSRHIIIVAGSLRLQEDSMHYPNAKDGFHFQLDSLPQANITTPLESYANQPSTKAGYYNTIYVFAHGRSFIADKNVLVPFGETLPLNALLAPIFESFFGGSFGFNRGNGILTLETQGYTIALANCYEGTLALPYNTGAEYIIMLSNNAWFYPSTQHIMQQMIAKYYARSYHTFIYHSTNHTSKAIITPNNGNH